MTEVETFLQETQGKAFKEALADLYEAFSEFAKDPSDAVNQNLVMQKSSLFVSRVSNVNEGLKDYQSTINKKITDDVNRINELGRKIATLNSQIQKIESAGVETAMDMRDTRDLCLDELSKLAKISYTELPDGVVKLQIDGVEFVTENNVYEMALQEDLSTGFKTPYWPQLSDTEKGTYTYVFNTQNANAVNNTDVGEVKALLVARGDHHANYLDMQGLTPQEYEWGLSNSIMLNTQAELDTLYHTMITAINDQICPNITAGEKFGAGAFTPPIAATDTNGKTIHITENTKILDADNCCVGSDGKIPPQEVFTRIGCERYTQVNVTIDGENKTLYVYNEEDPKDTSKCYTIDYTKVNPKLVEEESLLAHKTQTGEIAYNLGAQLEGIWDNADYTINPLDKTPCNFTDFYIKWIGEIGTTGSIYDTTARSLEGTRDTIENNRQMVVGVSSDEELTNMIKYQQAYNAASRYINVVSTMIDYLLQSVS